MLYGIRLPYINIIVNIIITYIREGGSARLRALLPYLCRNKHKGTPSMALAFISTIDGVPAFVIQFQALSKRA